jgi:hypothetical protein
MIIHFRLDVHRQTGCYRFAGSTRASDFTTFSPSRVRSGNFDNAQNMKAAKFLKLRVFEKDAGN